MKKAYWLVRADVTDVDKFSAYAANVPGVLEAFGGQFLVRGGESTLVEGSTRSGNTVVQFPSYQSALDCWHSEAYQAVKKLRLGAAELDIVIVEGLDA